MPPIRILAIEDDPLQAEALRLVLEELNYIAIEVTTNVADFQRLVVATVPDLLLIDIDLASDVDGIQLSQKVRNSSNAPIIFVTASKDKETILRAKDSHASAYITKPYERSSLQAAIEIAMAARSTSAQGMHLNARKDFFVKDDGRLRKVNIDEIQFVEVKEKFCCIRLENEIIEVNIRLKELIEQLHPPQFVQVHRSYVVALNHITEVTPANNTVIIQGTEIPIGKNYRDSLLRQLNKIG
jgi:DNA-binding LytR/AlgR family response regulator